MKGYWGILLVFLVGACGTSKTTSGVSSTDVAYIQQFHHAVRLKAKGQFQQAILSFDSCRVVRPNDDAVAYGLSQCYLLIGDQTNAAKYTEIASKLDPKNVWYTQELAYMYYEQRRFDEASKAFAKLVAKEPKNVDWWFGYAEVLKQQKKYPEAIEAYDKMQDQTGLIPDISIQKFQLYVQSGQKAKGIEEINKARKLYPDEPSLIGVLIDFYFQERQIDKAQTMLEELVKADPSNGRAQMYLGELYWRQNRKAEAYKSYSGAFQASDVDLDQKMNTLLYLYEAQQVIEPEVFDLANSLVNKYPDNAKPYSILGDFYLQNKEGLKALEFYKKALKIDDSKYPIWNQVLLLEYENRTFDELYTDARACAALFPTLPNVQLLYTIACVQKGRYTEAIDAADLGKELVVNDDPTLSEFYAQKGEALFLLKQVNDGILNYEKAVQLAPSNLLTKNNFAIRLALNNTQLSKAKEIIEFVIANSPKTASFMATYGMVLLKLGEHKNALTQLAAANQMEPNDKNFVEYLGDAQYFNGDLTGAVENWKKAKTLGSKNKNLDKKIATKKYLEADYE